MGNYQVGRLIGKGSFGKVYLATHKFTNGSKVRSYIFAARKSMLMAACRWCSSRRRKKTPTSRAKFTTTASSCTPTSLAYTKSSSPKRWSGWSWNTVLVWLFSVPQPRVLF